MFPYNVILILLNNVKIWNADIHQDMNESQNIMLCEINLHYMYKQITSFICYHRASKYSIFKSHNYEYLVGVNGNDW